MNDIIGCISTYEASHKRGVSERRVNQHCAKGRIPGFSRFGRSRAMPTNVENPGYPRRDLEKRR